MKQVDVLARTSVSTRARFARAWPGGWVVKCDDDRVLVVDRDLQVLHRHAAAPRLQDAAVDPDGASLFVVDERGLTAVTLVSRAVRWTVPGELLACAWCEGLWSVESADGSLTATRRDPASGAALQTVALPNPWGNDTNVMVFPHPDPARLLVWFAAGDGRQLTWMLGAADEPVEIEPRGKLVPVFAPTGDWYLVADDWNLELRTWPSAEVIDELEFSDAEDDRDMDQLPGSEVHIVPGGYAVWPSMSGHLHVIDLAGMHVAGELAIAPDFEYAVPGPDGLILSVHARRQLVVSRLADWSAEPSRPSPLG